MPAGSESGGGDSCRSNLSFLPQHWSRNDVTKLIKFIEADPAIYNPYDEYFEDQNYTHNFWVNMDLNLKKQLQFQMHLHKSQNIRTCYRKSMTTTEDDDFDPIEPSVITLYPPCTHWSSIEIFKLIDLVRAVEAVYDPQNPSYKDRQYAKKFWIETDKKLKKHPGECLAKWTNLRLTFKREYETYLEKKIRPGWAYFEKMYFLHPFLRPRSRPANQTEVEVKTQTDNFCRRIQAKRSSSMPPLVRLTGLQEKSEPVQAYIEDTSDCYTTARRTPRGELRKERQSESEHGVEREYGGEWEERGRDRERHEERERAAERDRGKERERGVEREHRQVERERGADHWQRDVRDSSETRDPVRERVRNQDGGNDKANCGQSETRYEPYQHVEPARSLPRERCSHVRVEKIERARPIERATCISKDTERDRTRERELRKIKAAELERTLERETRKAEAAERELAEQREYLKAQEAKRALAQERALRMAEEAERERTQERELRKIKQAELGRTTEEELRTHRERLLREATKERERRLAQEKERRAAQERELNSVKERDRRVAQESKRIQSIPAERLQSKESDLNVQGHRKTCKNEKNSDGYRCRHIVHISEDELIEEDYRCKGGVQRQHPARRSATSISEPSSIFAQQTYETSCSTSPPSSPRKKASDSDNAVRTAGQTVRFNLVQSSEESTEGSIRSSIGDSQKVTSGGVKHCCNMQHSPFCPCSPESEGDRLFLLSLLPDLQRLDGRVKGKVKLELQNVLQKNLYPK